MPKLNPKSYRRLPNSFADHWPKRELHYRLDHDDEDAAEGQSAIVLDHDKASVLQFHVVDVHAEVSTAHFNSGKLNGAGLSNTPALRLRGFFNLSFGANLLIDPPCHTMEPPGDRISAQAGEPLNVESCPIYHFKAKITGHPVFPLCDTLDQGVGSRQNSN